MAWLAKSEAFQQQYARARELWADAEFDNLMEIADTPLLGEKVKETAVLVDGKPLMGKDGQPILNREVIRGDMIEHRRLRVDARKWALARMSPKKYGDRLGIAGVDDAPLKVEILDKLAAGRARVAKLR